MYFQANNFPYSGPRKLIKIMSPRLFEYREGVKEKERERERGGGRG